MNMHLIDWLIVAALVVVSLIAALSTARYTRSVSAFLAADRCGRRYLIAMALAQFFEMRYSRNFRVFAGLVAFLAGIINFGIYPSVGARFFMAICGLPESFN